MDYKKLTGELTRRFDLPAGQFFEVAPAAENILRISIMEESGACTVQDWGVDLIDLPIPKPENFEIKTKTAVLAKAAAFAYEHIGK